MQIHLVIGVPGSAERSAAVRIGRDELLAVHLSFADPGGRNRTGRFMRRHPVGGEVVPPNRPVRSPDEPPKWSIPVHVAALRRADAIPAPVPVTRGADRFGEQPVLLAVPMSDLAANLLRPCFHRDGLGGHRIFHFEGEPLAGRPYWCACFFREGGGPGRLELRSVHFDAAADCALAAAGGDLTEVGLVWAAAMVPLVIGGRALSPVEIAVEDYDLRQLLGRDAEAAICYAYEGWYDRWADRVAEVLAEHANRGRPFAVFYHSILALDAAGDIHLRQVEGTLPGLATDLAREGMVAAGVLDSGGSCALYDPWLGAYLNHGWYFRESRGAVVVFQLRATQRVPDEQFEGRSDSKKEVK
jgi:hypothetical protein